MGGLLERLQASDEIVEPVAVVAAHPDDETIGLGSRLGRFRRLRLIYLTDGAPRDLGDARREGFSDWRSYAAVREKELGRALEALSAAGADRLSYGFPDQQAVRHLAAIAERLQEDLAGVSAVFTHPYEHGHPDHDSAALAVALACREMADPPARYEFASYHLTGTGAVYGAFWPDETRPEAVVDLSSEEADIKQAAIACFATQRQTLAFFPLSPERFRRAPDYDFAAAAPPGEALYDLYG